MPVSGSSDLALWAIAVVAAYKVVSMLVGLGFGYMGYRLFLSGLEAPAGDLEASAGSRSLKLSRAAPGTFFALFGATVVSQIGETIEDPEIQQYLRRCATSRRAVDLARLEDRACQ